MMLKNTCGESYFNIFFVIFSMARTKQTNRKTNSQGVLPPATFSSDSDLPKSPLRTSPRKKAAPQKSASAPDNSQPGTSRSTTGGKEPRPISEMLQRLDEDDTEDNDDPIPRKIQRKRRTIRRGKRKNRRKSLRRRSRLGSPDPISPDRTVQGDLREHRS